MSYQILEADYDIYTGIGPNKVIKYTVFNRPDSFNGEVSFMAGGEPLFQIGIHPETGTVAVTNDKFEGGVAQDGTNWVPAPFPDPQDGDRVYFMQFTSEGFVLKCFDQVSFVYYNLTLPIITYLNPLISISLSDIIRTPNLIFSTIETID